MDLSLKISRASIKEENLCFYEIVEKG